MTSTTAAAKRQQPKRQTKAQRQSGAAKAAGDSASASGAFDSSASDGASAVADSTTSLEKSDEPQDAKPAAQQAPKSGSNGRSRAQSGQRKGGPQRPKSPSKK